MDATPTNDWIACTDRLPEPNVVVELRSATKNRGIYQGRWSGDWWFSQPGYGYRPLPTHWRELPEK